MRGGNPPRSAKTDPSCRGSALLDRSPTPAVTPVSDPRCTVFLSWLPHRGEARIHVESWSDDGDRWWLSKTKHEGVEHPEQLLAELRYLLLEVEPVYE